MKILFVEPGKIAQPAEIKGELHEMQKIVGGPIQAIYPWDDPAALICNDEGKLLGLPLNRILEDYDVIAGNFFVCGIKGDSFSSLSDQQMIAYQEKFRDPELILNTPVGLIVERCSEEEYMNFQKRLHNGAEHSKKRQEPEW